MYVVKRDGRQEQVHFDKITARITKLSYGLNPEFCDPVCCPAFSSLTPRCLCLNVITPWNRVAGMLGTYSECDLNEKNRPGVVSCLEGIRAS